MTDIEKLLDTLLSDITFIEERKIPAIDLYMDAYIPPSYIKNELQKLNIYKRIAAIENDSEYDDMLDELNDRFGEPPKAVINLLNIALLKTNAHAAYILEIKGTAKEFRFNMYQKAPVDITKIPSLIEKYRGDLKFFPDANPYFIYNPNHSCNTTSIKQKNVSKDRDSCFEQLDNVIENIKSIIF